MIEYWLLKLKIANLKYTIFNKRGWPEFPSLSQVGKCAEFHHGASAPPFKGMIVQAVCTP